MFCWWLVARRATCCNCRLTSYLSQQFHLFIYFLKNIFWFKRGPYFLALLWIRIRKNQSGSGKLRIRNEFEV
jgi:hypothetical protein